MKNTSSLKQTNANHYLNYHSVFPSLGTGNYLVTRPCRCDTVDLCVTGTLFFNRYPSLAHLWFSHLGQGASILVLGFCVVHTCSSTLFIIHPSIGTCSTQTDFASSHHGNIIAISALSHIFHAHTLLVMCAFMCSIDIAIVWLSSTLKCHTAWLGVSWAPEKSSKGSPKDGVDICVDDLFHSA